MNAELTDSVVVLNAFTPGDVSAHLAGEDEEHARRFGWWPQRSTDESVRNAIERWERDWAMSGRTRAFAIRVDGVLVGGCELRLRDDNIVETSYWVHPEFRGRGFATRALRLATDFAFRQLQVERAEVYVEADNEASRAVAANAGYREEGVLRARQTIAGRRRDMVLYALLRSDGATANSTRA
jgi:RimJ/RimL family protein N-acetyltransferase